MTSLSVVPLVQSDIPVVMEMLSHLAAYHGDVAHPSQSQIEQYALQPTGFDARFIVAKQDEKNLGFASYYFRSDFVNATRSVHVEFLFTDEQARQRGVARSLLAAIAKIGLENGCTKLRTTAHKDNPVSVAVYRKLGFAEVDRGDILSFALGEEAMRRFVDAER